MLIVQNAAEPASIRNAIVDMVTDDMIDIRVASAYVTYSVKLGPTNNNFGYAYYSVISEILWNYLLFDGAVSC